MRKQFPQRPKGPMSAARDNWPDTPKELDTELPGKTPDADADYRANLDYTAKRDRERSAAGGAASYNTAGEPGISARQGRRR